ncbi:unnamed protein product [Hapterophycus canaliculatus]
MFPAIPRQTLASIWQNCEGDFLVALDEALAISSLGTASEQARLDDYVANKAPREVRGHASSLLTSTSGRPSLRSDMSAGTLSSSTGYETAVESRRSSATTGLNTTCAGTETATPVEESGSQKLPWEGKEERYVVGPGELGLLNELQMPRRGAVVPLAHDFLRVPTGLNPPSLVAAASQPLTVLDDDDRFGKPCRTFSPILPPSRGGAVSNTNREASASSAEATFDCRLPPSPVTRSLPARVDVRLPFGPGERPPVESAGEKPRLRVRGGDSNPALMDYDSDEGKTRETRNTRPGKLIPRSLGGEQSIGSMDTKPPARGATVWGGELSRAAHKVETASAAERIAAFRPGTRFRVAVDKGVTGLGITVKEIRGRFFVYRLQTLADGSQGAAEEAGIQAGDQLLGVEELDFEMERWDMDQLVSYMGELMGVVILHVMRGFGPLPEAPKSDLEHGMSYGVARADGCGTADGTEQGDSTGGNGNEVDTAQRRARRLVEVLEEEELSKPSEAADTARLYCQISDRARQWDTGELWLSVTDMARRPSRETLAAMANQWQPDPPPGWDESDSSEGERSPDGTPRTPTGSWPSGFRSDALSGTIAPDPKVNRGSLGTDDGHDHGADLDKIGTALLGEPLFSDPSEEGRAAGASSAQEDEGQEDGGHYWSPWPQLVALESKAAERNTVVPTQGLRKALNVRILEPVASAAVPTGSAKTDPRNGAAPQNVPYLVWVMDVESGAEWRVRRCHPEFAELWEVCTGMRPSLARLDFPPWLPDVKETLGVVQARRPRLEAYLQRLCSLLYMGPLHPSSAHLAHLLQDFLGTSPRVETLGRLQRSRPERELRQALQVRAWQVFRLPPLERAVADFVREVCDSPTSRGKKGVSAESILKRLTDVIEHLQYVVTEGCFNELREMVRVRSSAASTAGSRARRRGRGLDGTVGEEGGEDNVHLDLDSLAEEDEALELISGSVRRQVEAEVFVPVMARIYDLLRTEGPTGRLEKAVALGVSEARGKPQIFHGIPTTNLSPSSWNSSVKLLQTVGLFTLPCDKLDALMAVAHDIPALHRTEHPGDRSNSLGADDFLPIFIYVLVNSGVKDLAAQCVVLERLCDPKKMMGEAG